MEVRDFVKEFKKHSNFDLNENGQFKFKGEYIELLINIKKVEQIAEKTFKITFYVTYNEEVAEDITVHKISSLSYILNEIKDYAEKMEDMEQNRPF